MSKNTIFVGASVNEALAEAERRAGKRWGFRRAYRRVSFDKAGFLGLEGKSNDADFCRSERERLYRILAEPKTHGPLVIDGFCLFFKDDPLAVHSFLAKAKKFGVDIFAAASTLDEATILLFDVVFLGPSCAEDEPLFSVRGGLKQGEFLRLELRKHVFPGTKATVPGGRRIG